MASKYYAVKKGKVPGIYFNWNDCKAMVEGYQGHMRLWTVHSIKQHTPMAMEAFL